ncbi:hypothetical protein QQS21_004156 [Conoideocrella luteorostrata]|uniref:Peptidase S8/S53 domain-containing protein n=1 Tax=Conoideocrella luteorostrata TaxID=1105319 RepID=A0AAJ0CS19_9HYPO|nr:hypothetical protein QQS21_004156 [Conoideocrella luteorostrata]
MSANQVYRDRVEKLLRTYAKDADHIYDDILKGFSGTLTRAAVVALRCHIDVDFVETDATFRISSTQKNAPWGLERISNKLRGKKTYCYDESAGAGTCSYILDSGIDASHPQFGDRARQLVSFIPGQRRDGLGHGTFCAGLVGGWYFGVAKKTRLYGVKILSNRGRGYVSALVAGLNFVARDHKSRSCGKGVVVNISMGGPRSVAENRAVAALVRRGIFVSVAAGNSRTFASLVSPASARSACTVGAFNRLDTFASFSNFGRAIDVSAPGVNIWSAWPGRKMKLGSGTSASAAYVTGLAAYLAAKEGIKGSQLCGRIKQLSLKNKLKRVPRGTVNRMAFNKPLNQYYYCYPYG